MTPCDVSVLSRYLDGDLTLPERRSVEVHVGTCAPCRSELDAMRHVDRIIAVWGSRREPLPDTTEARIRSSMAKRSKLSSILAFGRVLPAAVGSSVAALLVLTTINIGVLTSSSLATRQDPGPSRSLLEKRSAPLVNARRVSAILGGRAPNQGEAVTWHHSNFTIE